MPATSTVIDVNQDNFAHQVLERSQRQFVLVDFYAHWCGPCQLLKPMLEKLSQEYNFTLAKIDIDANPELATSYGVSGVPDVRIAKNGELLPGFVGALPEPQLRELLTKQGLQSQLDLELAAIQADRIAGRVDEVKQRFGQLIQQYPDRPQVMLAAAEFLIQIDSFTSAEKILATIPQSAKEVYTHAEALRGLMAIKQEANHFLPETELDHQYLKAAQLTCAGNYEAALTEYLGLLERDRKYKNDAARKAMLVIFEILGNDHPLTKEFRKRLMLAL